MPTDLGRVTNDFLVANFPAILNYDFTAHEEEQFDRVAAGRANWIEVVDTFYRTFKPLLSSIPSGKIEGRLLGTDPQSGQPVYAKITKIGSCVQIGDATNEKPRFASLKKGQSIFSITLNEALELFETSLPNTLGEYEGKEVVIGEGKYGAYVHYNNVFISIPRGKDPLALTMDEAIALIREKQQSSLPVQQWGNIQVMHVRFGDSIHTPECKYQLPKGMTAEAVTEDQVRDIMAQTSPVQAQKRTFRRKNAK